MSATIPEKIPGSAAPTVQPYEGDPERMAKAWKAAASGNHTEALMHVATLRAGHSAHEIERLNQISEWFTTLEREADGLLLDLNAVTDARTIELSERHLTYIREAWLQMENKENPEPASPEVERAKVVLLRGDKLEEADAKRLYSFLTSAKEFVIPAEFNMETITQQMKTAQEEFKMDRDRGVKIFDMWSPV